MNFSNFFEHTFKFKINFLLLFIVLNFIFFVIYKYGAMQWVWVDFVRYIAYVSIPVFLLLMYKVRFFELPKSVKIFLGAINLLCLFYFMSNGYPAVISDMTTIEKFEFVWLKYLSILFSILSFWRVGFILLPLCYMHWYKGALSSFYGISVTATDYLAVVEGALFVVIGIFTHRYLSYIKSYKIYSENKVSPVEVSLLFAVASHFSNYFYSGLRKIQVSDWDIMKWPLENETYHLISNSWISGNLPLSFSDNIAFWVYGHFSEVVVFSNVLILIAQLAAILMITRIRTTQYLTFFYDITHVVIFITSGIFFYKWIIYNLAIIVALKYIKIKKISKQLALSLVATVILSPFAFFIVKLGWYDTPYLNDEYIVANMSDGSRYRLPSNYFLNASVTHAQQRVYRFRDDAFIDSGAFGNVISYDRFKRLGGCDRVKNIEPIAIENTMTLDEMSLIQDRINKIHRLYVSMEKGNDPYNYEVYPHHIFSMPWMFDDVKEAYKRDIDSYTYIVEGSCVEIVDKKPYKHIFVKMEVDFNAPK